MIHELKELDRIHNEILKSIENTDREDLFWNAHLRYREFLEDLQKTLKYFEEQKKQQEQKFLNDLREKESDR